MHDSAICRKIARIIPSVKNQRRFFITWETCNVPSFFEISSKIQSSHCLQYCTEGIVYCTCGRCLITLQYIRRTTMEKFNAHGMVLAMGKPNHNTSIDKRRIVQRKRKRINIVQSSSTPTSSRGKSGGGVKTIGS